MEINKTGTRLFDLYKMLVDEKIILTYEGIFDQEIIKSFLSMTEKKLINDGIEESIRKKLFNVLMEALQNISKHQKDRNKREATAVFILGISESNYFVVTGNNIENDKIPNLQAKLDLINSKDKEGLKELYKSARLNSVISDVGGAGLGFIDMARKSGSKLQYQFSPVSDDVSFFVLMVVISNN